MMRRHYILPALLIAGLATGFFSPAVADDDAGLRSVFARGAGGRALSLGGAYVAAANDATALIWNPAGLAEIQRKSFYASHTDLIGMGFSEQFVTVALPSWQIGTFSLALRRFGVDGIEQRDDRGAVLGTDLKDSESEFAIGYGRSLGQAWQVGAAFKMQQMELAGYSDAGLGLDLGLRVKPLLAAGSTSETAEALSLGLQFRNVVEPSLRLVDEDVPDPSGVRFGLAYDRALGDNLRALLVTDVEKTKEMNTRLHHGVEVRLMDLLAVRAGSLDGMLTAGAGVTWRQITLDYSFEDNPLETIHRFGLGIGFGATVNEKRQAALDSEEQRLQERLSTAFRRSNDERLANLVRTAESAVADGRHDEALDLAATLRVLAPDHDQTDRIEAEAHFGRAERLEAEGSLAAAMLAFNRCLALVPDHAEALAGRERVRTESDRQTTRTAGLRELFDRAMTAFTAGDLPQARDLFGQVVAQNPADEEARSLLLHTEQTMTIRASALAEQARGLALGGRLESAREALVGAERLDPECPDLAAAARAVSDLEKRLANEEQRRETAGRTQTPSATVPVAAPSFSRLPAERQEEITDLYRRGMEAAGAGRRDDAVRYWELVWSAAPDYQQVAGHLKEEYLARGMEAFAAGDLDGAIGFWEDTRNIDPEDARARGYLARARQQLTRIREIRSTQ